MEEWKDLARAGPVLATQTRALPQTQVLVVRTVSCDLERCLAGTRKQPDTVHPPCMTTLGWEVPLLCVLCFSTPLYTVAHGAKQDPDVPSLFPQHGRYRGSQGARECRERKQDSAVFPAPSPPLRPSVQRLLLFSSVGHSTRRLWKVSLKARGGGHDRIGAQYVQPERNRTRRKRAGSPE